MTIKNPKLCLPTTLLKGTSIIIVELFEKEDFEALLYSLNKLFGYRYTDDRYFRIYDKPEMTREYGLGLRNFPYLVKKVTSPDKECSYDLGEHIDHIKIDFVHVTPSIAMLKFHFFLENDVSKKIIETLNVKNKRYEKPEGKGSYKWVFDHREDMWEVQDEINKIRALINPNIIKILGIFKGYFYKEYDNDFSIFPTIDVFNLDHPETKDEVIKWIEDNFGFLGSITAVTPFIYFYKDDGNLLCNKEINIEEKYQNCIMFSKDPSFVSFDFDFELLGLERWIDIKLEELENLKSLIEQEVKTLEKNKLKDLLKKSVIISEKFLPVERLQLEFKFIHEPISELLSLYNSKTNFFDKLHKNILENIETIKIIKKASNEQMDTILNIKNIQFNETIQNKMLSLTKENKNLQEKVFFLSKIVIILTIVQIITAFKTEIGTLILGLINIF